VFGVLWQHKDICLLAIPVFSMSSMLGLLLYFALFYTERWEDLTLGEYVDVPKLGSMARERRGRLMSTRSGWNDE